MRDRRASWGGTNYTRALESLGTRAALAFAGAIAVSVLVALAAPAFAGAATVHSSSPTPLSASQLRAQQTRIEHADAADDAFSTTLTFDEVPLGSTVTDQYEGDGILFSGPDSEDEPFTVDDGSATTNPTLSGTPLFNGDIITEFVIPGTTTPTTVDGLSLDIGYINDPGSTQVVLYTTSGIVVLSADQEGFDHLSTDQTGIYGFRTEEVADEPAGYEIDNVSFSPGTSPAPGLTSSPAPGESFGGDDPAEPACQCSFGDGGDPVNTSNGNFWHTWTDVSVPGNGPALDLARTYNSLGAGSAGLFGNGWSTPYDAHLDIAGNGNVTVVQGNGSQVTYTQTSVGLTPDSRVTATLVANPDGSYTFTTGKRLTYTFDSSGKLTGISDLNGYTTSVAYPTSDQIVVTDPAGRTLTLALSGGHVTSATDPAGNTWAYSYDGSGNLTEVSDPLGRTTRYAYDSSNRMVSWTDPNGGTTTNTYDGQGRVTQQTDPLGRTTKFDYTSVAGGTIVTDPDGNKTLDQYTSGLLTSKTEGYGTGQAATWTYTYDPLTDGQTTITDPNGGVTRKTYDANGNVLTSTDPLGNQTTYTYDALNDLTSQTDALGNVTTYSYDGAGNLLSKTVPTANGGTATWDYGYGGGASTGDVDSVTDPNGNTTRFGYDASGDVMSITDAAGNQTTSTYDADGRRLTKTTANGGTTTNVYDADGEIVKTTDALGKTTAYAYDANGNQTKMTDAAGKVTTYAYNADNERTSSTTPNGVTTRTSYDGDGNSLTQTDGKGHTTAYTYDALNRVASATDADGHKTAYTYDGDGNVVTVVAPSGRTTTYGHDLDDRVTSLSYTDGLTPNVTIAYDAAGRRTSMTDGSGRTTYTYDPSGHLLSETDGAGQTIAYSYDSDGNVTDITYPNGQSVARTYNADEQLASVTDWLGNTTSFSYDGDGNPATEALPNGITATSAYDAADRLTGITDSAGADTLASFAYTRDALGQLSTSTAAGAVSGSDDYAYDDEGQLTGDGSAAYTYDSAGNLTTNAESLPQTFDAADELQTSGTPPATPAPAPTPNPVPNPAPTTTPAPTSTTTTTAGNTTLSAALSTPKAGELIVAFVSAQGGSQSNSRPTAKGLKWVLVTRHASHGGEISIWQARAAKALHKAVVSTRLAAPSSEAMLSVVAFAPGTKLGVSTAAAGGHGAPQLKLHAPAGATVWSVGEDAASGAARRPLPGSRIVKQILSAKNGEAVWLQKQTVAGAGTVRVGDRRPASDSWLLAAVVVKAGGAAAAGRRANLSTAGTEATNASFGYNADGDRTSVTSGGTTVHFAYDQANRLTGVGSAVKYAYDGDGLRTSKTVDGTTTQFTWDESGSLPMLLEEGSTYYVYGVNGQPIEQISGGTPTYLLADQEGSTRLLTDSGGNVVGTYTYDAWGGVTSHTGPATTNLQFDGQYTDAETGFQYLRSRYYDPSTGQFLTVDPAVVATQAPYSYAANGPTDNADPSGQFCLSFSCVTHDVGVAAGVVGIAAGAVALCAATACAGDIAVLGGASTLAETLGFAETLSEGAEAVGTVTAYVGVGANGLEAVANCQDGFTTECDASLGGLALSGIGAGIGAGIPWDSFASVAFEEGDRVFDDLYDAEGEKVLKNLFDGDYDEAYCTPAP
jgi:RHS repeat-associated protein